MKPIFFTFVICFAGLCSRAQELSIEDCYKAVRQNYPLVKQLELISKSTAYSIENAGKGYLPQVNINGQISYQTDVTKIPVQLPGMNIPEMSKDQYRVFAEASQVLYDGGTIKQRQNLAKVNGAIETQKLEVELYKLQERVNQLFFGVLFITEQLQQNNLIKKDIQLGIDKANTAVANGSGLKSSVNVLRAELLKVEQRGIEQRYSRKGFLDMLGLFINKTLPENTKLLKPDVTTLKSETTPVSEIRRPELKLYDDQRSGLDEQEHAIAIKNRPKFSFFLQGGVGKPALNMLSTGTEPFAIGGLKMSWPLSGLYTSKKEKAIVDVNRKGIDLQKETFVLNTNILLKQQDAELQKLTELMASDEEIIRLRAGVKKVSAVQLENGAINTSDYLRDVNAEDQARQSKLLHEIQLIIAQYSKQNTTGIEY
jgi:outer membrane protein TolC